MTKVQVQFGLRKPLDEKAFARIANAHSIYGIFRVKLNPALDGLSVEYDASRLAEYQVEATLACAGIPVQK